MITTFSLDSKGIILCGVGWEGDRGHELRISHLHVPSAQHGAAAAAAGPSKGNSEERESERLGG